MTVKPRWQTSFAKALEKLDGKSATLQLSTIAVENEIVPRVRTHILREYLSPQSNPSLPVFITNTDVRGAKIAQIMSNPNVEAVFWIEATVQQYRISGRAWIIPAADHPYRALFNPSGSPALKALQDGGIDWDQKRVEHFNMMEPKMRASWCRPVPGTKLDAYEDVYKWPGTLPKLGEAESHEDKKNLQISFSHFTLVIIDPSKVDLVEYAVEPERRTIFTRDGEQWEEQIVVP